MFRIRRLPALTVATSWLAVAGILGPAHSARASAGPAVASTGSIQQEQVEVVTLAHQAPISAAQRAVDAFSAAVSADRQALTADQTRAAYAAQALLRDTTRLSGDVRTLTTATETRRAADTTLAADRARMGGIAIGVYTGGLSPPDRATAVDFQAAENQILDQDEVGVVAQIIDGDIHRDLLTDRRDLTIEEADVTVVDNDQTSVSGDQSTEAQATAGVGRAQAALSSDENRLSAADQTLGAAESSLSAAVSALTGPSGTPADQLSLVGGAALTPSQLVAWFDYEGYVDLTTASIGQLAGWYIQFGQQEGVRGDVAFAQAVLETGGFSSPDAINLSNFAGIGHCDSCNSGWAFPSPPGGVLGQIQLLRIFADSGPAPAGAPGPVLPQLTRANQFEAGCCSTVQSLTGVWATDPTYGEQIMAIYSQMLDFALSGT